jgi:hypothetical protein
VRVEGIAGVVERARRVPSAAPQPVEAQPAGHDHQPSLRVVDALDVGARQSIEGVLHDILGISQVEQHAEREIEHPAPVRLPERGEPRLVGSSCGVPGSVHRGSHRASGGAAAVQARCAVTPSCGCPPAR